jgi:hypothetical protein
MVEIKNWEKLDNCILSTKDKMYQIHIVEKPYTDYWKGNKKRISYSMIIEQQFDSNVYTATLDIKEVDWTVNGIEIVLEIHHLKGIKKSFHLLREDITDLYDFTDILTTIVVSIDEQLTKLQNNLKRLTLSL